MRLLALALCLSVALTVTACFGGSSPERTYYALQYPMGDLVQAYITPRYPITLRIQRFDSSLAYNRQEMVYRTNPHEFRYYVYKLWASRPSKMLQELFANHLRQSNLANAVIIDIMDRMPEYEISAEILSIEELNASTAEWFAHLAMRMSMLRTSDNRIIWQYTFDERKPVFNQQPVFVVRAMSEIMEEQMHIITQQLDDVLSKEIDAPPPARPNRAPRPTNPSDPDDPASAAADDPDAPPAPPQPKARLKERR